MTIRETLVAKLSDTMAPENAKTFVGEAINETLQALRDKVRGALGSDHDCSYNDGRDDALRWVVKQIDEMIE
jgi:hypothetical protein